MSAAVIARSLFAGAVLGSMAIVFSISFAAIIYSGDMAAFLSRGIGLTLFGATVMALVGALRFSYRGTIALPQDVTALILSLVVASVAADWSAGSRDQLFATVATLVAVTTAITGLVLYLFGRLRLGFVVRYMPYPVIGGFLAATGYFLTTGALGMTIGENISLWSAGALFEPGNPVKWAPWLLAGLLFCVATNRIRHGIVLPACILAAAVCFYLALWLTGIGIDGARAAGLLLGPFDAASFYAGLGTWIVTDADWGVVVSQLPSIVVVIGMAIIGSLLNASGLELATGKDIDPDHDLRAVGIANLLASVGGGMVGYHVLSQTLFARALGVTGSMAGVAVALFTGVTLFSSAAWLSVLPIGVFAAVIAFLGIDLLFTWLWTERRHLPARDFAIVLLILGVAATVGFLQAIAVGLLAASVLFVIAYARIDVVRLRTTVAAMPSRVERGETDMRRLSEQDGYATIYQLSGYLFFGTASRLQSELVAMAASPDKRPRFILVDFKRVQGIDASAAFALGRLDRVCAAEGVELIFSGLDGRQAALLERSGVLSEGGRLRRVDQLDDALQIVEEQLLAHGARDARATEAIGFLDELKRLHPQVDLAESLEEVLAHADEQVIEQGAPADSIIVLQEGRLRVEYLDPQGAVTPVARILPGALVGEIGLYAHAPRTARVVAEQASRLLRISADTLERLGRENPMLVADIHRLAASYLARRLIRAKSLLRDADM